MQAFQFAPKPGLGYALLRFAPDSRWLAAKTGSLTLLDTTGRNPPTELPFDCCYRTFAFVRGGEAIAYLAASDSLGEYDLAGGRIRKRKLDGWHVTNIAADWSGETLALIFSESLYSDSSGIRLLRLRDLEVMADLGMVSEPMVGLRASADGRWVAAESRHRVRAWHVGGAKLPKRATFCATTKGFVTAFDLSADGGRVAMATGNRLELWDTAGRKRVVDSGKHRRGVTAVACSPSRPLLATGDNAGNVFLWDFSGNVLARYDWGLGEVYALTFAPDGLRCAAVDEAGKVVIWDVDA